MRFPHCLNPSPAMTDDTSTFSEAQASVLIGTAEKMVDVWTRLSPEKQAALLARFGSEENAIAALVTTQLVAGKDDAGSARGK
ncbi:hypothetical protein G7W60_03595 [Pseudomonas fluorescens]|uniref:hypothetical protein n=1 Tax=Pseudomonas TaxID=286 RepID=UPI001404DA5A|nr:MULTISPECIES: hypothetical protein [Pseudomonas]MDT8904989.1 hypothetical protein [Pseudomonas prosekii]NHN66922.1 hypothetical protein [Pseudomonas fluorescens]